MSRRIVLIIAVMVLAGMSAATEKEAVYKIDKDVFYRGKEAGPVDGYMEQMCRLDLYCPADSTNFATVVWFHGGGLTGGQRFIPEALKNRGLAVAAAGYRLSPKVKCPAYIEDAAAATAWVFAHIEKYGGDPNRIFVSGHSAGGYLTSMIGLDKRWLAKEGVDADRVAGLIPLSGQAITHFTIRQERGIKDTQPVVDEFAPLFHVRADAPPLVLVTGDRELELLGRYEENAYLARMMKTAGHTKTRLYEVQGFNHGQMAEPGYAILLKHVEALSGEKP